MAEIIGISAGRKNKVTESSVKAILEGTGKESIFISLSGKTIRPCEGWRSTKMKDRPIYLKLQTRHKKRDWYRQIGFQDVPLNFCHFNP